MDDQLQPALLHLTGPRRGERHTLVADGYLLGTSREADICFPADETSGVARRHARLRRGDERWRLEAAPGARVYVNGEATSSGRVLPGDVIQLGREGPLLRFRLEPAGASEYKSLRDALADCVACARYGADSVPARVALLLETMPRELFGHTSPWVRALMVAGLVLGVAISGYQVLQSRELGDRLARTRARLEAVAASVRADRKGSEVTPALRDSLRRTMNGPGTSSGGDRPEFLTRAAGSVILVQGAYHFEDPASGRTLRLRGGPRRGSALGSAPEVSPNAGGPPLRRRFTGTAFAVSAGGHFVTNRHLVRPWEHDDVAQSLKRAGYRPVFHRLSGYLPGREDPVELELVLESDSADLALLRAPGLEDPPSPLRLGGDPPPVGEELYVVGYPTGIRALLARSDPAFVASLRRDSAARDPWEVTERLAAEGAISPLTTRGIVGQVSPSAVVYDAQTSRGGSGGPVLGPDGRVVAVNKGVMPEFGGANLGVPVRHVRRLLDRAGIDR